MLDNDAARIVDAADRNTALKMLAAACPHSRTDRENLDNPDVVLVQAPGWGVNTPPLATSMLAAFARSRGRKVLPLDLNVEFYLARPSEFKDMWEMEQSLWFWNTADCVKGLMSALRDKIDAFVDLIIASGAPVVGFTIYDSSMYMSIEIARLLKRRRPGLCIVMGGPHVSRLLAGNSIALEEAVDAVAQGEGELTLMDILERVETGRSLADCPGLLLRVDGRVVDTGDRGLIRDLEEIPAPDFSDYSFDKYREPTRLPIVSSRGCPNRCIYCNEQPYWRTFRFRYADSVFAEIKAQMARYPFIKFIDFQDSLVNGKIRELDRLADLIIESGLKIEWSGQAVIRKEMTAELMLKLKRSGCVCLAYGLETPSLQLMQKIGKLLSKGADLDAIAEAHGKTGLGVVYNVMFGLPGETETDAFLILEFLRRNFKNGFVVNPSPSFCGFSPGTQGWEHPERYDIDLRNGGLFWQSKDGHNTYVSRLKRFEDFCRLVSELGIKTTYPATRLLDRNRSLGQYYEKIGDLEKARWYYEAWLEEHPEDEVARSYLNEVIGKLGPDDQADCIYMPPDHSDSNWINGVADGWAAAVFVPDTNRAQKDLAVGKAVVFSDGAVRTITETRENAGSRIVFFDGAPLDGRLVGYPNAIKVIDTP